jgi:hypothetical protein
MRGYVINTMTLPDPELVFNCEYLNPRPADIKYRVAGPFDFIYLNLRLVDVNYRLAGSFDFILKEGGVYENSVLTEVDINVVITRKFFVSPQNFIP